MLEIKSLKCIFNTNDTGWAIELAFDSDVAAKRVAVDGADDIEMILEAFEESTAADFNPETGEIRFSFEYASMEDEDEDEDEEEGEDSDAEDDGDEDQRPKA